MKVVILGAGVIGCATALELSQRGVHDIVLLERAVPGAEASSAAAGMLAAQVEANDAHERARFVRARDAYAAWAEALHEESGIPIGYRRTGVLELAQTEEGLAKIARRVAGDRAAGLRAELVDPKGVRAIDREISTEIAGGAWLPDEAQVDPPQLLRALISLVSRRSVVVRGGTTVTSLRERGGRFEGVGIDTGEIIEADAVVVAAGSWSSLVPGLPQAIPKVRPVRGQLVMLEERPPKLATIAFLAGGYVVPRGDGRVLCGSTMEDAGHRREVTASGVHAILGLAIAMAPRLGEAELSRSWCNFRPFAEGGAQIGRGPWPGLFLATGHHRNGILLAKATAEAVADAVLEGETGSRPEGLTT